MTRLILALKTLLSFLPSRLPVGVTEYQDWMDSIIELAGPMADKRSMEYVISTVLIHADAVSTTGYVPKRYFVTRLIKAAATQCAHYKFQEIKIQQAEEAEAKKAETNKVEDTTHKASVSDVQKAAN